jgi:Fe-S cluster assembly protein SufD
MTQTPAQQAVAGGTGGLPPWRVAAEQARQLAPGLDWLAGIRDAARSRMMQHGLPGAGQEDWRYTNLDGYAQRWADYLAAPGQAAGPATVEASSSALPATAPVLTVNVVDGLLRSPPAGSSAGLTVQSLRGLTPALQARAARLVGKADSNDPDRLVDLNTALLEDGVLIATSPASCPPDPVHVRLTGEAPRALGQPRLLVDLAPNSRLTLILEYSGAGGTLVNAVTQVNLGAASQLNLIRLQRLPGDGMLLETTELELAESASVTVTSVDIGSQLSRQAITVQLAGRGAEATINGVFLADGRRHIANQTRLLHRAPATTSREVFRGIADGHGRGVFNGKIVVLPGAAGSNAALTNRNLLLTPTAEIDTKPELEIYVDDVRCSHGATTGQLDANALFYLRSRGLDPAIARQVLTAAFLREGFSGIDIPELRLRLDAELQARLGAVPGIAAAGTAS